MIDLEVILFLYLLTSERWAVSGTECRRRGKGRGRRSEQRERGLFRALKLRPVGRCCFWHGAPLKMRPVQQEAIHSLWSRLFCGPFKMRSVEQDAVFALSKMHSVEQEAV